MRLLDLFCGAGGAAMGYSRAGFSEIVGVDIKPQPRYPFAFVHGDALDYVVTHGHDFDAIHASPPCQAFTTANARFRGQGGKADRHSDLLTPTVDALRRLGMPYVVENVEGAARAFRPMLRLTGHMFALRVWRPRLFETSFVCLAPDAGAPSGQIIGVYGERHDGRYLNSRTKFTTANRAARSLDEASSAMGIDWMNWRELCEAIPPAYTEHIGRQLLQAIEVAA